MAANNPNHSSLPDLIEGYRQRQSGTEKPQGDENQQQLSKVRNDEKASESPVETLKRGYEQSKDNE